MTAAASSEHYYVPEGSKWPIIGVVGIFLTVLGIAFSVNDITIGSYMSIAGLLVIGYLFFGWFGDVIDESMSGKYSAQVDISFRQGMIWFITSDILLYCNVWLTLLYPSHLVTLARRRRTPG